MLWYILRSFTTDESMDECYTIQDLLELKWHGDTPDQVATVRSKYDDILMHIAHPIPEATLLSMTFAKMKESKVFAEDLAHFSRVGKNHEHHTLAYLQDCMDRFEMQHLQEQNRAKLRGAVSNKGVTRDASDADGMFAAGVKGKCFWFQDNSCTRKNCPFLHEKMNSEELAQMAAGRKEGKRRRQGQRW